MQKYEKLTKKVLELTKVKAAKEGYELTCVNRFGENIVINIEDNNFNIPEYCKKNNIDMSLYCSDDDIDIMPDIYEDTISEYMGVLKSTFNEEDFIYITRYIVENIDDTQQQDFNNMQNLLLHPYYYAIKQYINSFKPVYIKSLTTDTNFWEKYNSKLITNEINRIKLKMLNTRPEKTGQNRK